MIWANFILFVATTNALQSAASRQGDVELICHSVYFTLKDAKQTNIDHVVQSCRNNLSKHDEVVLFACGERTTGQEGAFKDNDFHVSLTMIFRGRESVERYMKSEARQRFVAECKPLVSKVRVFESNLRGLELPGVKSKEPNKK